jgi:hypothetical protein
MTIRPSTAARRLAIAISSGVALATAVQAQMLNNDLGAGIAGFGNLNPLTGLPTAQAPPLAYGADAGFGETDNVKLTPTDKISQTIATTDFDLAVNQQSRLLDVKAAGAFTDLVYLQGAYGNEFIGRFDGLGQVAIIPERLTWVLRDDFGQASVDAFTPITPNNREDLNYVSTGPDLYLRLGATSFIKASARYANAYYQTSPYDSNRGLVTLAGGLELSAHSSVSLNGAAERVLFQNTVVNSDFDRYSAFARYEAHGARTDLAVNLGATTVDQSALAPTVTLEDEPPGSTDKVPVTVPGHPATSTTGPLGRLELSRALSPAAKLTLTAGRELTDAASSFSTQYGGALGSVGTLNFAPTPLTTDPFTQTYASIRWQYLRYRTGVLVSGQWERDSYPGASQFDLTRGGAEVDILRQLTPALTAQLVGRWYKVDYPNATVATDIGSPENDNKVIGAALVWRQGRWLEVRLRYDHTSYDVSQGDFGYSENRVFLTVGYRPRLTTPEIAPAEPQ